MPTAPPRRPAAGRCSRSRSRRCRAGRSVGRLDSSLQCALLASRREGAPDLFSTCPIPLACRGGESRRDGRAWWGGRPKRPPVVFFGKEGAERTFDVALQVRAHPRCDARAAAPHNASGAVCAGCFKGLAPGSCAARDSGAEEKGGAGGPLRHPGGVGERWGAVPRGRGDRTGGPPRARAGVICSCKPLLFLWRYPYAVERPACTDCAARG